ncbi:MAG: hypothetical protein ACTSVI_04910 [Promethearchaeota archaeon]
MFLNYLLKCKFFFINIFINKIFLNLSVILATLKVMIPAKFKDKKARTSCFNKENEQKEQPRILNKKEE